MKISFLLPTRDRLEYLRQAVETIRLQSYDDWEIVISDNASGDGTGDFVHELADERIRYFRTERVVPVADNWNNALDRSTGDYVLMLGDDDGLLPEYCSQIAETVRTFDRPDVVYSRALMFAYPGVMPGADQGYVHMAGSAECFDNLGVPRTLRHETARALVKGAMDFRLGFDFNMQFFTVQRSMIERLRRRGKFFHSPFPDYYAATLLLLHAQNVVVHPDPLVIVGITPKSYGFFHFNKREGEGIEFLQNMDYGARVATRLARIELPGNRMNTYWLVAMETLRMLDTAAAGFPIGYRRYRRLQLADAAKCRFVEGSMTRGEFGTVVAALRPWEKLAYGALAAALFLGTRLLSSRGRSRMLEALDRLLGQYPRREIARVDGQYENLLDLFTDYARTDALSSPITQGLR